MKDRGFYLRQITSLLTGPHTSDIITHKTQALPCVVENLYHESEEVFSCAVLALKPFYDCLADKNEEVVKKLLHVVDTSDSKDIRYAMCHLDQIYYLLAEVIRSIDIQLRRLQSAAHFGREAFPYNILLQGSV